MPVANFLLLLHVSLFKEMTAFARSTITETALTTTNRAFRVFCKTALLPMLGKEIYPPKTSARALFHARNKFQALARLHTADQPCKRRKDADRGACCNSALSFRKQAVVTGRIRSIQLKNGKLPGKTDSRAGNQRLFSPRGGKIDRITSGKIVAVIKNNIRQGNFRQKRLIFKPPGDWQDVDSSIDRQRRNLGRLDNSSSSPSANARMPTPAAARYKAAAEPSPPRADNQDTRRPDSLLPATPNSSSRMWRL